MRAARHTCGSVRAYASLIEDGYRRAPTRLRGRRASAGRGDLDELHSRHGALSHVRERARGALHWGDVLARVATAAARSARARSKSSTRGAVYSGSARFAARALSRAAQRGRATARGGIVRVRADHIKLEGPVLCTCA